jgi:hypothetical protein
MVNLGILANVEFILNRNFFDENRNFPLVKTFSLVFIFIYRN